MFIKICGITNEDDALLAVAMGADAVGFIFAPSQRQIAPMAARDIVRRLPPDVLAVGVFRNELPGRVADIVHQVGLGAAQLHGHETAEETMQVKARVPIVIKAFVAGESALHRLSEYGADAALVEGPVPGSGQTFDWSSMAKDVWSEHRLLLAGGLHPDNVEAAIASVNPWGVDVATGVEKSPGRKDPVKVKEFIRNATNAAGRLEVDQSHHHPFDWMRDD